MNADAAIGANLLRLRGEHSQKWVSEQMRPRGFRWAQATVWGIEKGNRPLRLSEAVALAGVFAVSVDDLLTSGKDREIREASRAVLVARDNADNARLALRHAQARLDELTRSEES